jgi:putative hydrolase
MPKPVFKTYKQIDADYILSDMHMHSTWTDGQGTIEQNIIRAKELGLKQIAATDHIRHDSTYFEDYFKEIKRLREELNFSIYAGFEAKVNNFDGELDVSPKNLALSEISICSVHRFPIGRKLIPAKAFNAENAQEIELELSIAAINRGGFTVMGHPGGMSIRAHNQFKKEYFEEIIIVCKKNGIAFDFNASYTRPADLHWFRRASR